MKGASIFSMTIVWPHQYIQCLSTPRASPYIPAQSASIDFDALPILENNKLTIGQGQALLMTSVQLMATQNGVIDPNLLFTLSNITHATIWVQSMLAQAELVFTQRVLTQGGVTLIQDGSIYAPGYAVSVSDGRIQTLPETCKVTFYQKPEIVNNQIFSQNVTVLTTDNLCVRDCIQTTSDNFVFIVLNTPDYGQFELVGGPGQPITSFSQKQVKQGLIQFQPSGVPVAPRYQLLAADPTSGLSSDSSTGNTLLLLKNIWPINQNETFTLTPDFLNATSSTSGNIVYTPIIDTVTHGYFALAASPNYRLPSFQQSQVTNQEVVFIPDGGTIAPTTVLTITDTISGGAHG